MFTPPTYDISIWEEIRTSVERKIGRLVDSIKNEISTDGSLAGFHGKEPVPWQLREIMQQRGNAWVQRVYDLCCDAYKTCGKTPSDDFDRAIWAYRIDPFIIDEKELRILSYTGSGLLQLLLCAVGSPPEKRNLLKVSQKECCLFVRLKLWETWRDKLLHLPPRINEAVAAISRFNAMERRAARIVRGLAPDDPSPSPSTPPHPLAQPEELLRPGALNSDKTDNEPPAKAGSIQQSQGGAQPSGLKAAAWDAIEISFLSDERVQIRNGANNETLNYAEFGFEDGRSGKPNQAWTTLRALAEQRGSIRDAAKAGRAWPKVEKRVQEIRKVLRKHFFISADPIPFVEGIGYRALFKISCRPSFDT